MDIIGVQETIKKYFYDQELKGYTEGQPFFWDWIPTQGHSGGILLGIKDDRLEIEGWHKGRFYMGADIRDKLTNFRWRLGIMYGPTDHEMSEDFLKDLGDFYNSSHLPIVLGGDFNLIRDLKDKSNN